MLPLLRVALFSCSFSICWVLGREAASRSPGNAAIEQWSSRIARRLSSGAPGCAEGTGLGVWLCADRQSSADDARRTSVAAQPGRSKHGAPRFLGADLQL